MKTYKYAVPGNKPLGTKQVMTPLPLSEPVRVELTYPDKMFIEAEVIPAPISPNTVDSRHLTQVYEVTYWEHANKNNRRHPKVRRAQLVFNEEDGLMARSVEGRRPDLELIGTCADIVAGIRGTHGTCNPADRAQYPQRGHIVRVAVETHGPNDHRLTVTQLEDGKAVQSKEHHFSTRAEAEAHAFVDERRLN